MSKKIRVLYTIPNFDTAGSGKVLYDLANGLKSKNFEIEIACSNRNGIFFKDVEALGLPIHIIETTTNYKPYFSLLSRIRETSKFFKSQQYDIVHSWHWSSDWTEAMASKLAGVKWIYTKKAMSWGNRHWKIRSFLADFIITINDEMRNYFPKKKSQSLIPLGLDTRYYSPEQFNNNQEENIFKIVTVANLVPVKGIETLFEALKMLNDPTIYLDIVGDDRSEYARDLKNSLFITQQSANIKFLGKKNDVRPYLAQSDLYVIPTLDRGRKEGMPMALVEAMAMSTPVIGSNISGINFVLKDFQALLIEAGNAIQLAEKIKWIKNMNIRERKNLGNQLRIYCLDNFTMEKFIDAHESLYRKLVG